jgi:hypothetical protein
MKLSSSHETVASSKRLAAKKPAAMSTRPKTICAARVPLMSRSTR